MRSVSTFLGKNVPDFILGATDWIAFDTPKIPSETDVTLEANKGDTELKTMLGGLRDATADMNTRCITAGPTASLMLVVSGVLKASLNKTQWLYVVLLVLAGIAVFASITGLSAVPFNQIGLTPKASDAPKERLALRPKEA